MSAQPTFPPSLANAASPTEPARARRRLPWRWIALAVAAAILVWVWASSQRPQVQYQTQPISMGTVVASVAATGTVNAVVQVDVGSQVSGNIQSLYADFNSRVKKGQLVAQIDPSIFQAQVNQAKAALGVTQAAVANARAGLVKAQADVSSAQATVKNQQANLAHSQAAALNAQGQLNRRIPLYQQGIISAEDFATAQATFQEAVADRDAAQAQLDAGQHALTAARAAAAVAATQVRSAEASAAQSAATLAQAQLNLDHTRILAPVDGIVVNRLMNVGQTVAASFQVPAIFTIAQDLTKMQVDTNVDEADVGQVKVGQEAPFTVDAFPATTFHGVVAQVREAPTNVQNVVTYDAVVTVNNPELKLFPGMTANVRIITARAADVLRIPNAALRFTPSASPQARNRPAPPAQKPKLAPDGSATVYVLSGNNGLHPVAVKPGISDGQFTVLESGDLREGERVVVAATAPAANRNVP